MAQKTYAEKLKDPRWQKKRLDVLNEADFQCEICNDSESTLHVHHKHYIRGREPWEYDNEQLVCLCMHCHQNQHDLDASFQDLLSRIPIDGPGCKDEVFLLLAGFLGYKVNLIHKYQQIIYKAGDDASLWWRNLE